MYLHQNVSGMLHLKSLQRADALHQELTVFQRSFWNPAQIPKPLISCLPHLPSSRYPHSWRTHNMQQETTALWQWKQYVSPLQWICPSEKTSLKVCPSNQSPISSEGSLLVMLLSKQQEVQNHCHLKLWVLRMHILFCSLWWNHRVILGVSSFYGSWHSKHHKLEKVSKAVFFWISRYFWR